MDDVRVMIIEGWINACNPREPILDEDLGETNVGVTILNYTCDIAQVMSIWRWFLSQTILDGFQLFELLVVYNDHHMSNDNDEGALGVKKKQYCFFL